MAAPPGPTPTPRPVPEILEELLALVKSIADKMGLPR